MMLLVSQLLLKKYRNVLVAFFRTLDVCNVGHSNQLLAVILCELFSQVPTIVLIQLLLQK